MQRAMIQASYIIIYNAHLCDIIVINSRLRLRGVITMISDSSMI